MARTPNTLQRLDDIAIGLPFVSAHAYLQLARLMAERVAIDGWTAGSGESERVSGGGSSSTPVEAAMMARYECGLHVEQIRDDIDALAAMFAALKHTLDQAARWRAPAPVKQIAATCHDGQLGKSGVLVWGDTPATDTDPGHHCLRPQEKSGLCPTHYMRWYRHTHKVEVAA